MATVLNPVEGIKLVPDIFSQPGVETLEGRIGPLLTGARGACHFIELMPGQYLEEHPHKLESLIYAASGEFVLCSRGDRWHVKTGTVFWFGDDVPTGWEVPFDKPATILIFKTEPRDETAEAEFLDYLRTMAAELEAQNAAGTPLRLSELASDHPARAFARSIGAPLA